MIYSVRPGTAFVSSNLMEDLFQNTTTHLQPLSALFPPSADLVSTIGLARHDSPSPRTVPSFSLPNRESGPNYDCNAVPSASWASCPSDHLRSRPAPISDISNYVASDDYSSLSLRSSSSASSHQHSTSTNSMSRQLSNDQDFYPLSSYECDSSVRQKRFNDDYDLFAHAELPMSQTYTTYETVPIFDWTYASRYCDGVSINDSPDFGSCDGVPKPEQPFTTLPSLGALYTMPSYVGDLASMYGILTSHYDDHQMAPSPAGSLISSALLSPIDSPRIAATHTGSDLVQRYSRGPAAYSSRPKARVVPYIVEGSKQRQIRDRPATAPAQYRRRSSSMYQDGQDLVSPTLHNPYIVGSVPAYHNGNGVQVPFWGHDDALDHRNSHSPPILPIPAGNLSHRLLRMLQGDTDVHSVQAVHYHPVHHLDLSDPPDLYGSLEADQPPPPNEDMHPENAGLIPRDQEVRFDGDMYTPRWVRGYGNKREGWCGACKPGRWLVLKNSAFWYDKSFTHGISAATGQPFREPLDMRRMEGNLEVWEGLCTGCQQWIALVSSKKKGTTWFRHAYKCLSHPKVKTNLKRRRESAQSRLSTVAKALNGEPDECIGVPPPSPSPPAALPAPFIGVATPPDDGRMQRGMTSLTRSSSSSAPMPAFVDSLSQERVVVVEEQTEIV